MAAQELYEIGRFESQTQPKKNVTQAIKNVAEHLGNRPATCRKYYVHPVVIDAYMDDSLFQLMEQAANQKTASSHSLSPEEGAVLKLIEQHLLQESKKETE